MGALTIIMAPVYQADIAGEALTERTLRQIREVGGKGILYRERERWPVQEILSTVSLWDEDRITILQGDVVWPDAVLCQVLTDGRSPMFYGNYGSVFAMGFANADREQVLAALEYACMDVKRRRGSGGGGWWQFYNAVAGFDDLRSRQWNYDVFVTVPSVGTPSQEFTQRLRKDGDYYAFLEKYEWARSPENWPHGGRETLNYLVTGTGRCGSGFAARLLSSVGLVCGHEGIFGLGGLEQARRNLWDQPHMVADSSWMAAPFLESEMLRDAVIIHLVRHPRLVIESAVGIGSFASEHLQGYSRFSVDHLEGLAEFTGDPVSAEAFRYVHWNAMIEQGAGDRHLLFNIEDNPLVLVRRLGVCCFSPGQIFTDRTYNTRGEHKERLSLDDIAPSIQADLLRTMEQYGYNEW